MFGTRASKPKVFVDDKEISAGVSARSDIPADCPGAGSKKVAGQG